MLLEQPYDIQYSIMEQLLGCLADDLCYGTKPLTVQQAKKMRTIKAFKLRGAVKEGLASHLVAASSYAREIWKREEESLFARLRDNRLRKCEESEKQSLTKEVTVYRVEGTLALRRSGGVA
jgi:hypothetical protein